MSRRDTNPGEVTTPVKTPTPEERIEWNRRRILALDPVRRKLAALYDQLGELERDMRDPAEGRAVMMQHSAERIAKASADLCSAVAQHHAAHRLDRALRGES